MSVKLSAPHVALCKQCLSFKPADRPADANAMAQIVGRLRREAEDRARQAELDRAKAEIFAAEQRKRRRVWLGLAAALLVGVFVSSGLALWANHARDLADQARQKEAIARETAEDAQKEEANAKQLETTAREKAEQAQRDEARAKKVAVEQAALANGVKDYLMNDLLAFGDPAQQQQAQGDGLVKMDPDLKVRDLILRAAKAIDGKFVDQPLVEAEIRWSLGYSLHAMGRSDLALAQFERMRQLYAQAQGPAHPNTIAGMSSLAVIYYSLGRHAEACKFYEDILALQRQKLGPDHPLTLLGMSNLASIYSTLDRRTEALKLREDTLALRKQKLGPDHPDHPDTLDSMGNVIDSLVNLKRTGEVLPLIRQGLKLASQAEAAGKRPDPQLVPKLLLYLLRVAEEKRDAAPGREAAEGWERLNPSDMGGFYDAACYRAALAKLIKDESEARVETDKAMAWLKKAIAKGFNDRAHVEDDTDLDTLRVRADFKALVASIPYIAPPPRAVR